MTSFKPFILTVIIGALSLFSCRNRPDKSISNSKKTELDSISFGGLSQKAYDYLNKQQEICDSVYKISTYQSWYFDQTTGELSFSDNGIKKLIVDYEEVGSVSEVTNTFLWAWANPHIKEKIKSEIGSIKEYGRKRNFEKLISPKWTADQHDGWEMTAIACYLLKGKGAYRAPTSSGKLYSFMIFKDIRWADTTGN